MHPHRKTTRWQSKKNKHRVTQWRKENGLEDDLGFAHLFADFEEAYSESGNAVAVSWSRKKMLAEPGLITDPASIRKVEGTVAMIRSVDEFKKIPLSERVDGSKAPISSPLRYSTGEIDIRKDVACKMRFT